MFRWLRFVLCVFSFFVFLGCMCGCRISFVDILELEKFKDGREKYKLYV